MYYNISTIYKASWQKLQGRWAKAVVACLTCSVVTCIIVILFCCLYINIVGIGVRDLLNMINSEDQRLAGLIGDYTYLLFSLASVVCLPVTYGVAHFLLNYYDKEKATISMIFSPMLSVRIWSAMILRYGAIFLYTLLLIVPGVMKLYSYALADYLLAEDQTMTGLEAMRESERLMKGHRWELFKLDLLILPCFILSRFTFDILDLWLVPYYHTMHVCFYHNVLLEMDE